MKVAVLGTSEFTKCCLQSLLDCNEVDQICHISLLAELCPLNSFDLNAYCKMHNLDYLEVTDINNETSFGIIKTFSPDIIFSTWPHLISEKILSIPRIMTIGTHPTDLPQNRGRHPIHWLMCLGYKESKLTFFKMDPNIDSGDVIHKESFNVFPEEPIQKTLDELNKAAINGAKKSVLLAKEGRLTKQNGDPNYWRKRDVFDCIIDLRMTAQSIIHLVNSFASPYPCCKLIFKNNVFNIISAQIVPSDDQNSQRLEPGKIVLVQNNFIVAKVSDHLVKFYIDQTIESYFHGKYYIYPPNKYFSEYTEEIQRQINV